MFHIKCFAVAPYSVEQMFNIVNDVCSYTEFIPGFNKIHILKQESDELVAEIDFKIIDGLTRSLITHNFFVKNKSIIIFLMNSPFKIFYGCWRFSPISKIQCQIEYVSYYDFQSMYVEKIVNVPFQHRYKNIIKIFISRANKIYGSMV